MFRTISVIGGDLRQLTLADALEADGNRVRVYGFDKAEECSKKAESLEAAAQSDMIILPLPVSHDQISLNAPFSTETIPLEELIVRLTPKQLIFGGKISSQLRERLSGITCYDYFEREELSVANAIPTAEGAIEIALSELPRTLHRSRCLVVGFGRIGKVLADRLRAFGACVTVSARKYSDFAWINAYGYQSVSTEAIRECAGAFDVIFNTVPHLLFGHDVLERLDPGCLLIDLASKPGGVDFTAAKELGVKVIWALSLPGKTAPITSGEMIKKTITNIMKEMEES